MPFYASMTYQERSHLPDTGTGFLKLAFHFLRLGRPLFLAGGFLLHGLGATIALYDGAALNLAALLWGQVAVTAIQWMVHYANDYFDLAADRANLTPTQWSGGSRVLLEGRVPPRLALAAALILAAVALLAALILAFRLQTGPLTLPLLLLALALAWSYSAPPLRLHSRGVGELVVALLVPGLTILVGYYLQAGRLARLPFLAAAPLVLYQFVMLLAIELPDAAGDAAAGKATLVVRLGGAWAAHLMLVVLALAYLLLLPVTAAGLPERASLWVALFSLPLSLWFASRVRWQEWDDPRWWNWIAFFGVALVVGAAAVELVAFLSLLPTT